MSDRLSFAENGVSSDIQFNVVKLVEVDSVTQGLAETAITAVWRLHMSGPATVNLRFADRISLELPDGSKESVNALYQRHTDTINIALGTLQERYPKSPLGAMVVLHAGHEARHKVQVAMGDIPPDADRAILGGTYMDGRHEIEAWESAVDAFSAVYPGQTVSFPVGSRIYSNQSVEQSNISDPQNYVTRPLV